MTAKFKWGTAVGIALCLGCYAARADDAPKGNVGFSTIKTQVVELGDEIEGMSGRQLRLRVLKIEPNGHIGIHSHKDRPSVVYFLQGTDTLSSADGSSKTFHPGDTTAATKDTTHWHKNNGTEPVVLIAVDVFHNKK